MTPRLAGRRVLVTTDAVGGVWRYAVDLAACLVRRDVAAILLGLGPGPSAAQRAEAEAAGVALSWLDGRMDWTLDNAAGAEALARDLADRVAAARADVLHLNAPALAGAVHFDLPVVAAAHSCLATWWRAVRRTEPPDGWGWHRRLTARGLRRADVSVVPSRSFAADLVAIYGPLQSLRVIPNGAHPIAPLAKAEAVLAAGRWWDACKNVAALDAAAAHIDWPLEAAGPAVGPAGEGFATRHLRLLGTLDPAAMAERIARAPIFVSLSLYEPFGLAVLEAASAGAALVLSDIPTFRELWDGAGVFVDPAEPADAARAINRLIHDQGLRRRLGAAACRRARAYSVDRQVDALMVAYSEALGARCVPWANSA